MTTETLVLEAWDLYRATEHLPWNPSVYWARVRLHDLIGPHALTYGASFVGLPDVTAIRDACAYLTEVTGNDADGSVAA